MSNNTWLLPLETTVGMEEQHWWAGRLHEDPTPVGFKCSINSCGMSIDGKHSICLLSCIPNCVCMWASLLKGQVPRHTEEPSLGRFRVSEVCWMLWANSGFFYPDYWCYFTLLWKWCCSSSCSISCCYFQVMGIRVVLGKGAGQELGRGERVWLTV